MLRVHIPKIFPQDLTEQLEEAIDALPGLASSTLRPATYILLNNIKHLDVTLPPDLLRNVAWFCVGYRRSSPGVALTTDWLIDSLKCGRVLPVEGYQITVVWHQVDAPSAAWMEWRDAGGRVVASRAQAVEEGQKERFGHGVAEQEGEEVVMGEEPDDLEGYDTPSSLHEAQHLLTPQDDLDEYPENNHPSYDAPSIPTETSSKKQPPANSTASSETGRKRGRPRKNRRTTLSGKTSITRSISTLTALINSNSKPLTVAAASPSTSISATTFNGKRTTKRQRKIILEEDKAALDRFVDVLSATVEQDVKRGSLSKSLAGLCESLDHKDPHPKGIMWRSFYRSYEMFILQRVPGLNERLHNRTRSASSAV